MCALFGWLDYKGIVPYKTLKKLTQALANAAEERGTDATGISYIKDGNVTIFKRPKPAHKLKFNVISYAHYIPRILAPFVRLIYEKIGRKTDKYGFAAFYLVIAVSVFFQRQIISVFQFVYESRINIPLAVKIIHIAILAALAHLVTAVPRIPCIHL